MPLSATARLVGISGGTYRFCCVTFPLSHHMIDIIDGPAPVPPRAGRASFSCTERPAALGVDTDVGFPWLRPRYKRLCTWFKMMLDRELN